MKTLSLFLFLLHNYAYCLEPIIEYSEMLYKTVAANTEFCSTGKTPANNQKVGIYKFRINGASPSVQVIFVYDRNGGSEKIFAASFGDVDLKLDLSNIDNQIMGDGIKKFQICIINNGSVTSPIVGGSYEGIKL